MILTYYIYLIESVETAIFYYLGPPLLCTISLHPFLFHTPCICTSTCSLRMQSTFQNDDRTNFSCFLQPKFLHVLFFNRNKWTNATTIFDAFHMLYCYMAWYTARSGPWKPKFSKFIFLAKIHLTTLGNRENMLFCLCDGF